MRIPTLQRQRLTVTFEPAIAYLREICEFVRGEGKPKRRIESHSVVKVDNGQEICEWANEDNAEGSKPRKTAFSCDA